MRSIAFINIKSKIQSARKNGKKVCLLVREVRWASQPLIMPTSTWYIAIWHFRMCCDLLANGKIREIFGNIQADGVKKIDKLLKMSIVEYWLLAYLLTITKADIGIKRDWIAIYGQNVMFKFQSKYDACFCLHTVNECAVFNFESEKGDSERDSVWHCISFQGRTCTNLAIDRVQTDTESYRCLRALLTNWWFLFRFHLWLC